MINSEHIHRIIGRRDASAWAMDRIGSDKTDLGFAFKKFEYIGKQMNSGSFAFSYLGGGRQRKCYCSQIINCTARVTTIASNVNFHLSLTAGS